MNIISIISSCYNSVRTISLYHLILDSITPLDCSNIVHFSCGVTKEGQYRSGSMSYLTWNYRRTRDNNISAIQSQLQYKWNVQIK